jgi:hypothetical protein
MSEFKLLAFILIVATTCVLGGIGVNLLLRSLMNRHPVVTIRHSIQPSRRRDGAATPLLIDFGVDLQVTV